MLDTKMTCCECGSVNLIAHYQADPKPEGYGPTDNIPATLIGVTCDDCGELQQ